MKMKIMRGKESEFSWVPGTYNYATLLKIVIIMLLLNTTLQTPKNNS